MTTTDNDLDGIPFSVTITVRTREKISVEEVLADKVYRRANMALADALTRVPERSRMRRDAESQYPSVNGHYATMRSGSKSGMNYVECEACEFGKSMRGRPFQTANRIAKGAARSHMIEHHVSGESLCGEKGCPACRRLRSANPSAEATS